MTGRQAEKIVRKKIPRVVKVTAETRAADTLRELILDGTIPLGMRITEVQLAEEMDIARATVRTALHQLASEGLVLLVPYTGWTVISLTERDVWELFTLRSCLERLAGQLAARGMDDKKRQLVRKAYGRLVDECRGTNYRRIAEADFSLHKTIVTLAEHSRLSAQYGLVEQQVRIYIRSSDALITNPDTIAGQHEPLVEAILAADEEQAGYLSELHNLSEGEKLLAHMRESRNKEAASG